MKTLLHLTIFLIFSNLLHAQITTPIIKAGFGVDGDLKGRMFNGNLQVSDDWFVQPGTSGTSTNGTHVIDTTGADISRTSL